MQPHPRRLTPDNAEADAVRWVVYLLRCADGTLYCGVTTDLARRIAHHNKGTGARYTRSRTPVTLLAHAPFADRSAAQRVEYDIKRQPSGKKLAHLAHLAGDTFVPAMAETAKA